MNNFVFGSDPLLYSQMIPQNHSNIQPEDLKRQIDMMALQYQNMQAQYPDKPSQKDHLGDLDNLLKNLDCSINDSLAQNEEFVQLNAYIQQLIQSEIMRAVKWQINANPEAVQKINRLKEIISNISKEHTENDKKNLSELNDYIKNYSDLTFNEYKQLKQGK